MAGGLYCSAGMYQVMGSSETVKTTVTLSEETEEWLHKTYPDALSLQEAIRMAVSESRIRRELAEESQ
jgi:hypothetical protein